MSGSRVNARLDDEGDRQLRFLVETTGLSVSDVIKTSLTMYYTAQCRERPTRVSNLRRFVGAQGSGRTDVASNVKDLFTIGIGPKIGLASKTGRLVRAPRARRAAR